MKTIIDFKCKKCGNCCRRGFVYLKEEEIKNISSFLKINTKQFIKEYTENILWLGKVLKFKNNKCIFLTDNNLCLIYEIRPYQCRTFPNWGWIVKKENWQEEIREFCNGV
ncbi:MAG: YkgJ family cysteine cluster protein [Candidatus Goldbacteria bacterium]|nr:YkgJ family cysteine cluster protein [Candidatus Goldiibacteriota bacterium]